MPETRISQKSVDMAWDFHNCENVDGLMSPGLKDKFDNLIEDAGFALINSNFHKFGDGGEGISYTAIIGESHVTIHTWPESGELQITIDYCNYTTNNDGKALKLYRNFREFFKPCLIKKHPTRYRGTNYFP